MSGIFGIVRRDGAPVGLSPLENMRQAMANWGRDGFGEWSDGCAALGQARTWSTPESRSEALPLHDQTAGWVLSAAARLDNREGLLAEVACRDGTGRHEALSDDDLLLAAFRRWGARSPARLLGDWSFAAWHPAQRELFLARDQYGHTALYYYADERTFAFASSHLAILALRLVAIELDELHLAQYLISWQAYHGQRAAYSPIRRLPPAHVLTVTADRIDVRPYWGMEEPSQLRLPRRSDYAEAFRDVFDAAVRSRLRSCGPIAATLSGGLDSGSVASTAARLLGQQGARLPAFTAVPIADTAAYVRDGFGDELPLARATATFAGNIDLSATNSHTVSPIEGIRRALDLCGTPVHAAANMFWILDLMEAAQQSGCRVLLTGAMGNATISWHGSPLSQPLAFQLRRLGAKGLAKARLSRALPRVVLVRAARRRLDPEWYRSTAINPTFARRLNLIARRLEDPDSFPRSPLQERLSILMPGRSTLGSLWAEMGARFNQDVRDPTCDLRVIEFTMSVPDWVFIDPDRGLDRWLIRDAMRGRLPDQVRLNRSVGMQAADLVRRLRDCADEVETALDELATGPAGEYVDVPYMRDVWRIVQHEDTPESFRRSVGVLTRGIMGGLYVNALAGGLSPSIAH